MSNGPEKNLQYYRAKAEELLDEAKGHGITSLVIFHEDDPLSRTASLSWFQKGDPILATGMLEEVRNQRRAKN